MLFPPLTKIRQHLPADWLEDVPATAQQQLAGCGVAVRRGERIAIAVGSRGIAGIAGIVREIVAWVRAQGGEPYLVPAMGSHGGATAAGQQEVLASYGLTEENTAAPVRSSMDVIELPHDDLPVPVTFDRLASEADGTIVVNRIKPHTSFHGRYESGLMKMLAIGLGKRQQASAIHTYGVRGLRELMPQIARQVLRHANIRLGVAIVENAREQTMRIEVLPPERFADREPELLELARANMPRLPVDALDILFVDEMGKDISGVGMDTNIIGRMMIRGEPEPASPQIEMIVVRDLTDASHGNAVGMGLADIARRRLLEKVDFAATYANLRTTTFLQRGKIPVLADTDRQATELALRALGPTDPARLRICRIRNTLHIDELYVSPAVRDELAGREDIEQLGPPVEMFDDAGEFLPF